MGKPISAAQRLAVQTHFLNCLSAGDSVRASSETAGIDRRTLYRWKEQDAVFAEAWKKAQDEGDGPSVLEQEAIRRAVSGVKRPVYRGGEVVGHVTDYSDSMLMFLLKAHHPEKYDPKASASGEGLEAEMAGAKDALLSKLHSATTKD